MKHAPGRAKDAGRVARRASSPPPSPTSPKAVKDARKTKRMKSDLPPPRALTAAERLRGVFSFSTAISVIDDYLSTIQIDEDHPGYLFHWHLTNVATFVIAANGLQTPPYPQWLQTPPPQIMTESFLNDVMDHLQQVTGGHVAWVLLAPNTYQQFAAINVRLALMQPSEFMQAAARVAFPMVHSSSGDQYLATTYGLATTNAQQAEPNRLEAIDSHAKGQPFRQLFA